MVITGRIYDIVIVSDKLAHIILKKKMADKIVPVAITVFGFWKDKALKELKPKDKIKANVYMKSRLYNDKWYTDVYFKEIFLTEQASKPLGSGKHLFDIVEDEMVDTETGEII